MRLLGLVLVVYLQLSQYALAKQCEYALDGVDDSISFQLGLIPTSNSFTMSAWFKNSRKEKNSHIAQALFSLINARSTERARFVIS
jgi:hypothetical protein